MKQLLFATVFILAISLSSFSQDKVDWLTKKIRTADTVILVSHEFTGGIVDVNDSSEQRLPQPMLTIAGKPNYSIIKERRVIVGSQLDTLIEILNRPFQDRKIEGARCFMPHHAIFLIKNGSISYFDICFECRQFNSSKDLDKLYAFDNRKWTELRNYFLQLGFKYELD